VASPPGRKALDVQRPSRSPAPEAGNSRIDPAIGARKPAVGLSTRRWRNERAGIAVSATIVRKVLREEGLGPAGTVPVHPGVSSFGPKRRAQSRSISSRSTPCGSSGCTSCSSSRSPAGVCTSPAAPHIPTVRGLRSRRGGSPGHSLSVRLRFAFSFAMVIASSRAASMRCSRPKEPESFEPQFRCPRPMGSRNGSSEPFEPNAWLHVVAVRALQGAGREQ
jgi:hypothetical protein